MIHTDARFSTAIEAVVAEIEAATDAEIVVVAAPASGSYADLAWALGAGAGVVTLAFLCWSPIVFDAWWFPVDVAVIGALVGWSLSSRPAVLARLAGEARRTRQVREAARAAFAEENVHATPDRLGLLVYVSAAEARVELLPDHGLAARLPGDARRELQLSASDLDNLVAGLRTLGAVLARYVPATGANPNHIGDAPRVRG